MERVKAKIMCLAACLSIGLLVIAGLGANAAPGRASPGKSAPRATPVAIKAPPPVMPAATPLAGVAAATLALPLWSAGVPPAPGHAAPLDGVAGATSTLLPDGRWLLLGGAGPAGPVAAAALREAGAAAGATTFGALRHSRAWHTATLLPDGTVLVVGGVGSDGRVVPTPEVFDAETQQFRDLADTGLTPRAYHTATLLTEGLVLIVGGISEKGEPLQAAELWDPRARSTTRLAGGLAVPRLGHTARLLADGTVLLAGGVSQITGSPLQQDEVFDPQTRAFTVCTVPAGAGTGTGSAPHLEASIPADGATAVAVDSFIALRFSKPLSVTSVNGNSVRMTGPWGTVETTVVPAEGGMLAFITLAAALEPGATYTVTVAGPVDQEYISVSYVSFSFTTAGNVAGGAAGGPDWTPDGRSWSTGWPDSKWRALAPRQAAAGQTALSGQVLQLNGQPLENVTLSIDNLSTHSDSTGRFLLGPITAGHHVLVIQGSTANKPGKQYGRFEAGVDILQGRTNVLPYTIWMTALDWPHAVKIPSPTTSETVITTPRIPGLELHLAPGTVITDDSQNVITEVSITPVPLDRPPFPLPAGPVPIYFTIQPGGAYLSKGARLFYPNAFNSQPLTAYDFWNYDPDAKGWYIYGQGTVSADGKEVVPIPGVVIWAFSGAMVEGPSGRPTPPPPPGNCKRRSDPVDLATGLFIHEKTDLYLPDILPISLTRTYRQMDGLSRPFGIGATHNYEIFLVGDTVNYSWVELILPDGARIHYNRTSPGTNYTNAAFSHTSTPTEYYGSTVFWNGNGWTLTLKNGTTYAFPEASGKTNPSQGALLSITDRYRNTLTCTRDSTAGNLLRITTPNGRWVAFTYDSSNRITQAADNIGRVVGYTYDSGGRLWKVTDPAGGVTTYTYDTLNRMLTITDPRNNTHVTNQYDANNRIVLQTFADSTTWQFAYTLDANGNVTQANVTDPRGNMETVTFNSAGYCQTDIYAVGKPEQITITTAVDAATNLSTSVTDALGRVTAYTYDSMGNTTSVTRMSGTQYAATTSFTYESAFNQLASVTDPLNHTTTFSYGLSGNLSAATDPLNNQTTFAYNQAGQPVSVTDPLGKSATFGYDSGDLVSTTDPLGNQSTRLFDAAGRVWSSTNAAGQTTWYQYDALGRVTTITDPLNGATSFTYDGNGNLLTVTDALNHTTSYVYNNMDRATSRTDPLSRVESYVYDANGNLAQFTDRRGKVTVYSYDGLDRRTFAGFGMTAGPLYDSTINYTYDAGSRLTQLVDSTAGTITRTYDNFDRLASETTPQGSISYTYDTAGRRTGMTVAGQQAVNYSYDNADRLSQISQLTTVVGFSYDAASRRTLLTLPNGIAVSYGYDDASRLTSMTYQLGQTQLGSLSYTYDAAGRVTAKGGTWARTNLPAALTTTIYDAANELTRWGTANLSYDANGNVTNDGTNSYTWSARNQLVSLSGAAFQYDPFGRRQIRAGTSFLYDGSNPIQELSGQTVTANTLAGGIDEFFVRADSAGARSLLPDLLGSTVALTDNAGAVQTQYTYEPFGNTTFSGATSANPFQFTGRENDGTGLYYYRARYYHPVFGRFISEDPIGFDGDDVNLYAYVGNDPVSRLDPLGLSPCTDRCRRFVRVCYPVSGGAGIASGWACWTLCTAWFKMPLTCRVMCSAGGAAVASTLNLACYTAYLECTKKCKKPECKQTQ